MLTSINNVSYKITLIISRKFEKGFCMIRLFTRLLVALLFLCAPILPVGAVKQQSRYRSTFSHSQQAHHKKRKILSPQRKSSQNKHYHKKHLSARNKKQKSHKITLRQSLTAQLQALQQPARARATTIKKFFIQSPQVIRSVKQLKRKQLSINFEHLILLSLSADSNGKMTVSGFHHDHQKKLLHKHLYQLKQIKKMKGGAYRGIISVGGKSYGTKSFFPASWSDQHLAMSIVEAVNNPIKKPQWDSMRKSWTIEGKSRAGVVIRAIVSQQAFIITAFPV